MKRILFVDDEPAVLEALQRSLYRHGNQWEMSFVTSALEALAVLDAGPVDVIVSDLRMPQMDGVQLLEIVRTKYPGIVRIALSGCAERETALRASGVVHQYLAKPCDQDELVESIDRFCASDAILPNEAVRRVVGAVGDLPLLAQAGSALVNALRRPDVTIGDVAPIIAQDVGMTAKVLHLVNSPIFGFLCEITSLQSALAVIGLDTLKELVLTAEAFRSFEPCRPIAGFVLADFEAHSVLTAKIAAHLPLAKSILPGSITSAFLHDIGKLVLAVRLPEVFERSLRLSQEQHRPLHRVEAEVIGVSHAEIGAYLLNLWGLSRSIVDAVCHHHDPPRARSTGEGLEMAGVVHVADALANEVAASDESKQEAARNLLDLHYLAGYGVIGDVSRWRVIASNLVKGAQIPEAPRQKPAARSMTAPKTAERCNRLDGELRRSMESIISMVRLLGQTDLTPDQRKCLQVLQSESAALKSAFEDGFGPGPD